MNEFTLLTDILELLKERLPSEERTVYKTVDGREVAAMIQRATSALRDEALNQKQRADTAESQLGRVTDDLQAERRLVTTYFREISKATAKWNRLQELVEPLPDKDYLLSLLHQAEEEPQAVSTQSQLSLDSTAPAPAPEEVAESEKLKDSASHPVYDR